MKKLTTFRGFVLVYLGIAVALMIKSAWFVVLVKIPSTLNPLPYAVLSILQLVMYGLFSLAAGWLLSVIYKTLTN